jgi:hypothetical protein
MRTRKYKATDHTSLQPGLSAAGDMHVGTFLSAMPYPAAPGTWPPRSPISPAAGPGPTIYSR